MHIQNGASPPMPKACPNLASRYLVTIAPAGADLALLIILDAALARVTDIRVRQHGPNNPPHIDATSRRLLVELFADLSACQARAEQAHHRADLQRIAAQLDNLLQRFALPKGAA